MFNAFAVPGIILIGLPTVIYLPINARRIGDSRFGAITSAVPPREIQAGLKLLF
jgi:hypothetical protein